LPKDGPMDAQAAELELMRIIDEALKAKNFDRVAKLAEIAKIVGSPKNKKRAGNTISPHPQIPKLTTPPGREDVDAVTLSRMIQKYGDPAQRPPSSLPRESPSRKQVGKTMRHEWLRNARSLGISLLRLRGDRVFVSPDGEKIGIACATERPQGPDKWWLGLPDYKYKAIVLLCKDRLGKTHDFVVPWNFLEPLWKLFSRSGEQVEFHVERQGTGYHIRIRGGGSRPLAPFASEIGCLRPTT